MKTVTLDGKTYACPFADAYDPHSKDELATLDASIARVGVMEPVGVYDSPEHGLAIFDGVTRAFLAAKHEKPCPVAHFGRMADDAAERLLDDKHLGRRNLTPKKQEERRAARVERVAEKRAEGKSTRQIAEEEGVSQSQVQRDLEKARSTEPGGSVEPEKVKGKDGKERPATRKPAENEPEPKVAAKGPPAPPAKTFKDALGQVIPPNLRDSFFDAELPTTITALKNARDELDRLYQSVVRSLSHKPYKFCHFGKVAEKLAEIVRSKGLLDQIIAHLEAGVLYCVCPDCHGAEGGCKTCRFGGGLPEWRHDELAGGA